MHLQIMDDAVCATTTMQCITLGAFHTRVRIQTFNVIRSFQFSFEIPSKTLISF